MILRACETGDNILFELPGWWCWLATRVASRKPGLLGICSWMRIRYHPGMQGSLGKKTTAKVNSIQLSLEVTKRNCLPLERHSLPLCFEEVSCLEVRCLTLLLSGIWAIKATVSINEDLCQSQQAGQCTDSAPQGCQARKLLPEPLVARCVFKSRCFWILGKQYRPYAVYYVTHQQNLGPYLITKYMNISAANYNYSRSSTINKD